MGRRLSPRATKIQILEECRAVVDNLSPTEEKLCKKDPVEILYDLEEDIAEIEEQQEDLAHVISEIIDGHFSNTESLMRSSVLALFPQLRDTPEVEDVIASLVVELDHTLQKCNLANPEVYLKDVSKARNAFDLIRAISGRVCAIVKKEVAVLIQGAAHDDRLPSRHVTTAAKDKFNDIFTARNTQLVCKFFDLLPDPVNQGAAFFNSLTSHVIRRK